MQKCGELHRIDGPAIERASDGYKQWWINGKLHRIDGPAIERADGSKEWWVDGKQYTQEQYNSEAILDLRSRYALPMTKAAI